MQVTKRVLPERENPNEQRNWARSAAEHQEKSFFFLLVDQTRPSGPADINRQSIKRLQLIHFKETSQLKMPYTNKLKRLVPAANKLEESSVEYRSGTRNSRSNKITSCGNCSSQSQRIQRIYRSVSPRVGCTQPHGTHHMNRTGPQHQEQKNMLKT